MYKYKRHDRIVRNYNRPFFSKRRTYGRLAFIGVMLLMIGGIPALTIWQFDTVQLMALDAVGYAPTATPFASDRAQQAEERFISGDVDGASALYEMAVTQQPSNVTYLYEYGMLLIEQDRLGEAAALGDVIMELAPEDPRGYALKSNALMWSEPVEAIPIAITGIELGQPFAPLNAALAVAYTQIGRYAEALQRADLAIRIDPMDANARRSYSYPLIFTGNYTEAIRQLEQAIAINPNLTGPYFELASLYRRIDQEEYAVSIYNRILEFEPDNERAYLRLCETYASVGLFREAEVFCDNALDIDPNYASAHRMRGQLRYSRRNYEGAIESFNTCVSLGSQEIECYYLRGLAHYFLAQCDLAWDVLNDSLTRAVQDPIIDNINAGLTNVIEFCPGYQGQSLPTPIPPTPIPPTPIGGF